MDKKVTKKKRNYNIYFSFYVIVAVFLLGFVMFPLFTGKSYVKRQVADYSDKWYLDKECTKPADLSENILHSEKSKESTVWYYSYLPETISPGCCLWFRAKNVNYEVYLDKDKVMLTKDMEEFDTEFAGTIWECIPLDAQYAGKMVKIGVTPCYDDSSCYIDNIKIGLQKEMVISSIRSRLAGTITCILLMFTGVMLILGYIILRKKIESDIQQLLYLGSFSIITSLWALAETKILQLFIDNTAVIHRVSCLSMMMIMPPLFLFFAADVNRYVVRFMLTVPAINIICNVILWVAGIADLHQTLTITHISIGICAIGVIYANIVRCFRKEKRTGEDVAAAVGMVIFTVFAVLDIVRYRLGGVEDSSLFTRIGLLIYVLILSVCSLIYVVQMVRKGMKTEFISHLAYEDGLTGLGNRTAYMERVEELQGKSCTIFMFDINNLKMVNDQYGHHLGDTMIEQGAGLIEEVFGSLGKCFRIGGDEFVCLMKGKQDQKGLIAEFYNKMKRKNENQHILPIPLVIAVGAEFYSGKGDIQESIQNADKLMYNKKKELKQSRIVQNNEKN